MTPRGGPLDEKAIRGCLRVFVGGVFVLALGVLAIAAAVWLAIWFFHG